MAKDSKKSKTSEKTIEVLYQKMAGQWYSFYVIDDDVFMGKVSENEALAARDAHFDPRVEGEGNNVKIPHKEN